MANWRKTRTPGVYVAHSKSCTAFSDVAARCRCAPSWRGRRWNSATGRPIWQRATKDRNEVLVWLGATRKGADHLTELAARAPTFQSLGEQWLDGVKRGHIGRRRARGKTYSDTTIAGMARSWRYHILPEFGPMVADEITELEWQRWIDQLARRGLSRSTIAKHAAVASAIYAWASASSRRLAERNPLRLFELPPSDEKPRMRVALAPEAQALVAALEPEDQLPYAIAFCAARRSTASNGPTSSRATRSPRRSWSCDPRAKPAPNGAHRSPTRSARSSKRRGSAKAARPRETSWIAP